MVAIRVTVTGGRELDARLRAANPKINRRVLGRFFPKAAARIQTNAAKVQIVAGGRGKGKALKPLPDKLTSRTGTLRRSIGINKGPLPGAIEIGTHLVYGAVHEFHAIRPRPFLQPALDAVLPGLDGLLVKIWKEEAGV